MFLAKTQYYIDDTNSTAWLFNGLWLPPGTYLPQEEQKAYNGTLTTCGGIVDSNCSGNLTFRWHCQLIGSSVDIYGVGWGSLKDQCTLDFNWSFGSSTYVMQPTYKNSYNDLTLRNVSHITFKVRSCSFALDYAVVTVDDEVTPSSSSGQSSSTSATTPGPKSNPPIGAIAGGVVGGVIVFTLLIVGIWITCRRRKVVSPDEITTPLPKVVQPQSVINHIVNLPSSSTTTVSYEEQASALAIAPSNSLAVSAREKQGRAGGPDGTTTRTLTPSIISTNGPSSSDQISKTYESERPLSLTSTTPAVQARLAQLQAEMDEIQLRGALPPPY
ncbi:hypothetical protein DL96DRAFT_1595928 [Flagelloscypha sp. PMI_526]|nr:hypothetical protein DL96DRAFT_1595928 [Flagelloscypha sp. PMI_526]